MNIARVAILYDIRVDWTTQMIQFSIEHLFNHHNAFLQLFFNHQDSFSFPFSSQEVQLCLAQEAHDYLL